MPALMLTTLAARPDVGSMAPQFRPDRLEKLKEFHLGAHCFGLSADAQTVVVWLNGAVKVYHTITEQLLAEFDGFADGVHDGSISRDGSIVAVCGNDRTVKFLSVRERKEIASFGPYNSYS